MIRLPRTCLLVTALGLAVPAAAQTPLTLAEAITRARAQNPEAGSAAAAEREAAQGITQARAGFLPRVDLVESWQRGNEPVFVFGSLLSRRQFTAADFGLETLNRPDAINHVRTTVIVEQSLFNGATRPTVLAAGIGREKARALRTMVDLDLAAGATDAYGRVLMAMASRQFAVAAVETARADRELAANRRDAGRVTDVDVLELDVYLSRALDQEIRAASDERIARMQLNRVMGERLEAVFILAPPATLATTSPTDTAALEAEALAGRPDVKLAALDQQLAHTSRDAARAAFLPRVHAQAGWSLDGGAWHERASSWVVGAVARVNLFGGFADKARLAEAREQVSRRTFDRDKVEQAARLDVQIAVARLEAARASEAIGRAAVAQAQESRRIVRDRYEAGLTDVTSLLRAAEAVVQAEKQQVTARVAVLVETAGLERTLGRR